jgi:hypothetical protein
MSNNLSQSGAEGSIGGFGSRLMKAVGQGLSINPQSLSSADKSIDALLGRLKKVQAQLDSINKSAAAAGQALSGVNTTTATTTQGAAGTNIAGGPTSSGGGSKATKMISTLKSAGSEFLGIGGDPLAKAASALGVQGFAKANPYVAAAAAGTKMANMAISAANNSMAKNRDYTLQADRTSVLYQQMHGLDQLGVSTKYRMPLTNYRLGAGGIEDIMAMESATGISGVQQASSIEAMRTISGYGLSTGDVTGMISNLANPGTANQMFMMGGIGLIGPGGKQKSMMEVMKSIVKSAGLTNKKMVDSAFAPGSVTRSKLKQMGVPESMVTQVLQYAKENLTYKEKGGKGLYDPSVKAQRETMGIEGNFATQVEETQRLETKRSENYSRRQVDNYAELEKQTQSLTKMFGALEDKLSGLIGGIGSQKIATSIFTGATGFLGDPPNVQTGGTKPAVSNAKKEVKSSNKSDDSIYVPIEGAGRVSISKLKSREDFKKVHPKLQERVLGLLRAHPEVGYGGGYRDDDFQEVLFKNNYSRTSLSKAEYDGLDAASKKDYKQWGGTYWVKKAGGHDVAAPGRSMHKLGLAVDLGSSKAAEDAIRKFAANYQLRHAGARNEVYHVGPSDLPESRETYEARGATWGYGTDGPTPKDSSSDAGSVGATPIAASGSGVSALEPSAAEGYGSAGMEHMPYQTISTRVAADVGGSINASRTPSMAMPASSSIKLGDPDPIQTLETTRMIRSNSGQGGQSVSVVKSGTTINLSPTINISGAGSKADLKKIANELISLMRHEVELENLRGR